MKTFLKNNFFDILVFAVGIFYVFEVGEKSGIHIAYPLGLLFVMMLVNGLVINSLTTSNREQVQVLIDLIKNQNAIIHNIRKEFGIGEDNA